jgi:SSS family solute:Na+ symporter
LGAIAIISFVFFTVLAATISYFKSRKTQRSTVTGFLFANRTNGFILIGASLFFSNISANQFIGENESVYINNMSVIGWGISSILAMIIVSEFFIPIYFKTGIRTIPDFLEKRYDPQAKTLVSVIFLFSYIINLLPSVLYGGSVAFSNLIDLSAFKLSYWESIWVFVWVMGLIGSVYTILGGFKAITISDTVLSAGMLVLIVALPYYGLRHLGHGDFSEGLHTILSTKKEHLNAIGKSKDAVPFATLFTGMFIINLYYWGMEQYIIQQVLAAKSLEEGQKGIALTCFAKLLCPLLINVPGLIAVHVYPALTNTTQVFPMLIKDVLPPVLTGLSACVLFGAAITTFNAGLNSSSTLFILNLYKPFQEKRGKELSDKKLLRVGRLFQIGVSLFAMTFAPFIIFSKNGFYEYLQKISAIFSLPIFTIIFLGFITRKMPPIAAKIGMIFFISCYVLSEWVFTVPLHYLHVLAIIFLVTVVLMLIISRFYPNQKPYQLVLNNNIEIVPWHTRHYYHIILIALMALVFFLFSPYVLA